MTYTLWDKTSPIYDITAEQAMINNPLYGTENSYLFFRDDGSIYDILPISTIRTRTGKTVDSEACEAYIALLTAPPEVPETPDISTLQARVAALEEELAAAKIMLGVE